MTNLKISRVYEALAFLIMVLLILVVFIQVFARRFLTTIPTWSTPETASLLLMWLVAIGASLAAANNSHLAMNYVVNKLPRKWKQVTELFIYALASVFLIVVAFFSLNLAWANRFSTTPRLDISMFWLQISIFVGAITMIGYYLMHFMNTIKASMNKNKP